MCVRFKYASFYHRLQSFQSLFGSLFLLVSVAVWIYFNRLQNTGALELNYLVFEKHYLQAHKENKYPYASFVCTLQVRFLLSPFLLVQSLFGPARRGAKRGTGTGLRFLLFVGEGHRFTFSVLYPFKYWVGLGYSFERYPALKWFEHTFVLSATLKSQRLSRLPIHLPTSLSLLESKIVEFQHKDEQLSFRGISDRLNNQKPHNDHHDVTKLLIFGWKI